MLMETHLFKANDGIVRIFIFSKRTKYPGLVHWQKRYAKAAFDVRPIFFFCRFLCAYAAGVATESAFQDRPRNVMCLR